MSDTNAAEHKPTCLQESKLYLLARQTQLLESQIPDIGMQMSVETHIEEVFPREPDDANHTRIFINFENAKGKSMMFKSVDELRLDNPFNIDHFLAGYMQHMSDVEFPDDEIKKIEMLSLSILSLSTSTMLQIDEELDSERERNLATQVVHSLIAAIYNDPKDFIISLKALPQKEDQIEETILITGMWIVKQRHLTEVIANDE